jgi:hypothetical protein
MKKLSILFSICLVLFVSETAFAQSNNKWKIYQNVRFGYSISYPSDLLVPRGEADNGDGQVFAGKSAEMRVFGSNLLLNETLLKEFNAVVKEHENVSYKIYRKNFFVVSGASDGKIFYQKTMAKSSGSFVTFTIEYDESKRETYDAIVARIVNSFK